ncbi:MAG: dockerin type I domain-containing protein, partial [Candidatus Bipolaricaulia bacterium]
AGRYYALAVLDFGSPDYLPAGQLLFDVKELHLVPIGDSANPPQDLDGDGLYEDINGDGQLTLEDPTLLGFYIDSPAVQENARAFDFNNDGVTDFDDALALKSMVEGQQAEQ